MYLLIHIDSTQYNFATATVVGRVRPPPLPPENVQKLNSMKKFILFSPSCELLKIGDL